jgi:hypothetical protein
MYEALEKKAKEQVLLYPINYQQKLNNQTTKKKKKKKKKQKQKQKP